MDTPHAYDALVVGAGPTGLAMATDLIRHGLRVRQIDTAKVPTDLSKAVVMMPRTLEEFHIRKLSRRALQLGVKVHTFSAFSNGQIIFHAEYKAVPSRYNYLVNIPQADTEMILREELAHLGGKIEWQTSLEDFKDTGDGVDVTIKGPDGQVTTERVSYLLGCDGAHSVVRHKLNLEFEGSAYSGSWMLADIAIDWKMRDGHGYSFFCDDGLLAVFQMPGDRYRIYVLQTDNYILNRQPTLEDLQEAVDRIAPGVCKLSAPHWTSEFHCHHRRVKNYRKGRVFVAGDAAHIHSPESGLGMNTGMQDSFNLAWKLAYVHKGICPPCLLDSYNSERSYVGEQVVALSDATHKMWAQFSWLGKWTREPLWRYFSNYYAHHHERMEEGLQIRIKYKPSNYVVHHSSHETVRDNNFEITAGGRALDGELQMPGNKEPVYLYDRLDPKRHHLIIFAGHPMTKEVRDVIRDLAEQTEPLREYLHLILILPLQHGKIYERFPGDVLLDPDMHFHFRYGSQRGALYVVRPDGYIGFASHPIRPEQLHEYLYRTFPKLVASKK